MLFANRSKVAESVSSLPDEMVELRHLNSALQSTLSDLEQRLAFMESIYATISNSATDTAWQTATCSTANLEPSQPPSAPRPTCPVCGKKRAVPQCHPLAGLGWQILVRSTLSSGAFQDTSSGVWTTVSSLDAPAPRYDHLHAVEAFFHPWRAGSLQLPQLSPSL